MNTSFIPKDILSMIFLSPTILDSYELIMHPKTTIKENKVSISTYMCRVIFVSIHQYLGLTTIILVSSNSDDVNLDSFAF